MLEYLATESRNKKSKELDSMSLRDILILMNEEDKMVPKAVEKVIPALTRLIEGSTETLKEGGRLIYIGAGTSGRLGILDAAECPPTFGVKPTLVQGFIAGGKEAFTRSVEGIEDSEMRGQEELEKLNVTSKDMVIGIAASGRTPYVVGGLHYAKSRHAATGSISCNKNSSISKYADFPIEVDTGSEVLTGSTRLKAGTAQKLVLNMISTATMIGMGKVYQNLMVDLQPTNKKLKQRSIRIIAEATGADMLKSEEILQKAEGNVKAAIVIILTGCTAEAARKRLEENDGVVRKSVNQ